VPERHGGSRRLLRKLIRLRLAPDAIPAAAALVVALDLDATERADTQAEIREANERRRVAAIAEARRGTRHSDETRAKISAAKRGRKHTPEHAAAIGAGLRGKRKSPEHVAAVAAARWGQSVAQ
jgi:hypothetical protein